MIKILNFKQKILNRLSELLTFLILKFEIRNLKLNPQSGFTMVELLIVMALTIGVAVAGFTGFNSFRKSQTLKLGVQELAATLSATRQRAIAQENSLGWGVRLTSGTSTDAHTYKVFPGSSFLATSTTQNYVLGRGAKFSNPSASTTMDIVFAGATGFPSSSQVISLINGFTDGQIGDVIVKSLGSIATRLDNGLIGYWHLDEGVATTTYDASGYGITGTLTNGPTWQLGVNCRAGGCLLFSDNYVTVSTAPSLSTSGSISVWVKVNSWGTNYDAIVFKGPGVSWSDIDFGLFRSVATSQFLGTINNGTNNMSGSGPKSSTITLGEWYNLVFTWDGTVAKFYTNGAETGSYSWSYSAGQRSQNMKIGKAVSGTHYPFYGYIDEVKIYNRALSASEILAAYNDLK